MTHPLFRDDAYLKTAKASVSAVTETGGIVLNASIFYPTGGGQPGDAGTPVMDWRILRHRHVGQGPRRRHHSYPLRTLEPATHRVRRHTRYETENSCVNSTAGPH